MNRSILPDNLIGLFRNRYALIRAHVVIFLLTIFSAVFSYPLVVWYLSIIGGLLSGLGVFIERKLLIEIGVAVMALGFYISNLALSFTLLNVIILVAALIIYYSGLMYINNLVKLNGILNRLEGENNQILENYRKKWNRSLAKKTSLSFIISILAFFIAWIGSFNFGTDTDMILLFAVSLLFAALAVFLIYLLIVKLPEFYR